MKQISERPSTTAGWVCYFAADLTCVGGYLCSLRLQPTAWRWFTGWWLGSLLLPAFIAPFRARAATLYMCEEAILSSGNRIGSSSHEIKQWILAKYGKEPTSRALSAALCRRTFLKRKGRFKLARDYQEPASSEEWRRFHGLALSVLVTTCAIVLPLRLANAQLRFVYGMAGAFRAMRLHSLLLDPESMDVSNSSVLSAAVLWGYHDIRTLQHIHSDTVTRLRRSLSCILAMVGHASVVIAAQVLLPAARSRQLTAALKAGMGVLSAATEWHLPLLCLRPARSTLDDPFASTSVAEFCSLYSLESWLCGAAYMSIEYHCRLLRFAHSCIEIEFLSMWTSVRRWRWNSPVQELLYSTCQSSRRHCTRRRMSTKARVWLLSCAMHMYGIFLLDSTALDPRTHLGIAVLFPLYFGLQACMIWTERQWPQFFSGVWWTRCAVLTTAQLVVWPSLRSTDL